MRPHRLVIEGLRSYRANTVIDFSDASLFAIVGDTGTGKSSILEALVYVLYAATTWGKQPGDLISDGMRTMDVDLLFGVDGRDWHIHRSMSRDGYPAPIHLLEAVDDKTLRFDGASAVNAQVERLLGLGYDAFISSVLLPQGKFATLLTDTAANRTKVLKGIFRLERLEEVREAARVLIAEHEPRLNTLCGERSALLANPAATAADAALRADGFRAERERLARVADTVAEAGKAEATADARATSLTAEAAALEAASRAVDPAARMALDALAAAIDGELAGARTARKAADEAETAASKAIEDAAIAGEDPASLAAARATLEGAERDLPALRERWASTRDELAAVAKDRSSWQTASDGLPLLDAAATEAAAAARAARIDASDARKAVDSAAEAIVAARQAVDSAVGADAARAAADLESAAAARAALDALAAQAAAEAALAEAEAALADARTADHAAAAAHGLHPGDECPVCARALPPLWVPPIAAGIESASTARGEAAAELAEARRIAGEAIREQAGAEARANSAATRAAEATSAVERATAVVAGLVPEWIPEADDVAALAALEAAAEAAETAADTAEAVAETAAREATAERARLDADARSLAAREASAREAHNRAGADGRRLRDSLGKLPAGLAITGDAETTEFERSLGRLEILEAAAAARANALTDATAACRRLEGEVNRLEARRRTEVDRPMEEQRRAEARLAAAVERAETALGDEVEPGGDQAAAAARADVTAARLADQVEACGRDAEAARRAGEAALADAGFEDAAALAMRRDEVTGELAVADDEAARAKGQVARASALDARIAEGSALMGALHELVRLLGDGGFPGFVVEERQRALLGVASSILEEMSGGRYGFAEDFSIVDRTSGQPRSARTLSGGETFQASLALALGLVELAGRSGGRLESLFLDEGFGTLDANALDEALEELERRAASGRVIGVISHLRSVADRLEHVLRVDKTAGRTAVHWVTPAEAQADNVAGVEHLAGLLP